MNRHRTYALGALMAVLLLACGRAADSVAGPVASGSRVSPSPLPTPTGTNPSLAAGDCVAAPAGKRTPPIGSDMITVQAPPGWSDTTSSATGEGSPRLQLNAPNDYGSNDVVLQLYAFIGPRPGSSSRHELEIDTAEEVNVGNWKIVGSLTDCSIGGEMASFVELSQGATVKYLIYVLHQPDQAYPYLYGLIVTGQGGIDSRSMLDAKRLLGSWTWGQ